LTTRRGNDTSMATAVCCRWNQSTLMRIRRPLLSRTRKKRKSPFAVGKPLLRLIVLTSAVLISFALLAPSTLGQKQREALSEKELIDLLKAGVKPSRVEVLARQYGVSFEMTPQTESHLRQAKVPDTLLKPLRELALKPAPPVPPTPATAVVVIDANAGDARVYIDDELRGTTGQEGLLKVSQLSVGEHKVRVSEAGYRDFNRTVRLSAGETVRLVVRLEATRREERGPLPPTVSAVPRPQTRTSQEAVTPVGAGRIWKSETTGREYRVRIEKDRFYAEWANLAREAVKGGAYIRSECRRVGSKWVGTSRIYLPCSTNEKGKGQVTNTCHLTTRIEIDSITPTRITGRGENLKRFDCGKCEILETGWAKFEWVPKR